MRIRYLILFLVTVSLGACDQLGEYASNRLKQDWYENHPGTAVCDTALNLLEAATSYRGAVEGVVRDCQPIVDRQKEKDDSSSCENALQYAALVYEMDGYVGEMASRAIRLSCIDGAPSGRSSSTASRVPSRQPSSPSRVGSDRPPVQALDSALESRLLQGKACGYTGEICSYKLPGLFLSIRLPYAGEVYGRVLSQPEIDPDYYSLTHSDRGHWVQIRATELAGGGKSYFCLGLPTRLEMETGQSAAQKWTANPNDCP